MSRTDSTLSEGFSSTIDMAELVQQLTQLEDQVNHLLACQIFYDTAIRAITCPHFDEEPDQESDSPQWRLGLFLQQQWLQDQRQTLINNLQTLRQRLRE